MLALSIALAGVLATACSSDASSASSTSSTAAPSAASQLAWLSAHVRQWNAALNGDQNAVDTAAAAGSSGSSSTFVKNLETACSKMLSDVSKAETVPKAPSATLQRAWKGMLSATETYATKCLKVAQSGSSSDLTDWQNSLKSMNSASETWNTAVNAVRTAAGKTSG